MAYEKVKNLKAEEFKRLCGVKLETFEQMVLLVRKHDRLKTRSGRPSKLSVENQVLMTLEYLREYRTYFHIGQSWGINESTVFRIVRKVEEILIKAKEFRLPGKKQLLKAEESREMIVVDVTETPREKPKKSECVIGGSPGNERRTQDNRKAPTAEKRENIH
jgi:Helix-turn-helix of DDE superfamily endonuclease